MGGRGASSGISNRGNKYGSQYRTLLKSGNIKFVRKKSGATEALLETMTRGRVYVEVNDQNKIKAIIYFDNDLKRTKRIDADHIHKRLKPHVQHGYYDNETDVRNGVKRGATKLTPEEFRMYDRVQKLWYNYLTKATK